MANLLTPPLYSKGPYRLDPEGVSGPGLFVYAHQLADRDRERPELARWPIYFAEMPGFDVDAFCDVLWHAFERRRLPDDIKPDRGETLREAKMLRRIAAFRRASESKTSS